MSDLLPPNSTPQERALSETIDRPVQMPIADMWSPDTIPASALPYLAWAFSTDIWEPSWTDDQKRAAVKAAFEVQRYKGTAGAVRAAVGALGLDAKIIEWFDAQPARDPYTYGLSIEISQAPATRTTILQALAAIDSTKSLRSHLNALEITTISGLQVYAGAHAAVGQIITVSPDLAGALYPDADFVMDFVRSIYGRNGASEPFNAFTTFERASGAVVASGDTLQTVGPDVLRINAGGAAILEPGAQNLLLSSENITGGDWAVGSSNVTDNAVDGPGGRNTMALFEGSSASEGLLSTAVTVEPGKTYYVSFYAKRINYDWARFQCGNSGFSNAGRLWLGLGSASFGTAGTLGSGYTLTPVSFTPVGDAVHIIMACVSAVETEMRLFYASATDNGQFARADIGAGAGVGTQAGLWGFEIKETLGSYVASGPTGGARDADQLKVAVPQPAYTLDAVLADQSTWSGRVAAQAGEVTIPTFDQPVARITGSVYAVTPAASWRLFITDMHNGGDTKAWVAEFVMSETTGGPSIIGGGVASAGSTANAGSGADKAFDGSQSTQWITGNGAVTHGNSWLRYDFAGPKAVQWISLRPSGSNSFKGPKSFRLEKSTDAGATWATVLTVTDLPAWPSNAARNFEVPL